MAVSKEADDAIFDALNTKYATDTTGNGLANTTQVAGAYSSNAYLRGGFARVGDPQRTTNVPRIEVEILPTGEVDTPDHARVSALVRLIHTCERNVPNGFGSQGNVVRSSRALFHRASLATTGGWTFSTLERKRGFQAPSTGTQQRYIVEYAVLMSAGIGGGF